MLARRIIPCLDVKDGRTVKGVHFEGLRDAGDAVELAKRYSDEGADELVFLDIAATHEQRDTLIELVKKVGRAVNIPYTVGGGIKSVEDVDAILHAGADKVSINSAALKKPQLINELAEKFGCQCVVVAIDARQHENGEWVVYANGGRIATERKLVEWVAEVAERGAGEILFTSMNHDGTKNGFANDALAQISSNINIPLIASGGAGAMYHFAEAFLVGKADAALAASVFHYKEIQIPELKSYLKKQGIPVRLTQHHLPTILIVLLVCVLQLSLNGLA